MDDKGGELFNDTEMDIPIADLAHYNPLGDPKAILSEWAQKLTAGTLDIADFKNHWRVAVPRYYSLEPGCDWDVDSKTCDNLIEILEIFIAGGNFQEEMQKIKEANKLPSVCAKVFKVHLFR